MKPIPILLILAPLWLAAQPANTVDSLQKVLVQKRAAQDRAGMAEALLGIGTYYYEKQEDKKALEYILAGLQQVSDGNIDLKGKLLYRKAMLLYFIGEDFSKSLPILDSAYALLKPGHDPKILGPFCQSYGTFLNQSLQYKKGQVMLMEAEQICLNNKEPEATDRLLNIYSNLLAGAYALGDYEAALNFARKGIETGKNSVNYELIGDLYYNNALTLAALGYEKEAEQNYLKSLESDQKGKIAKGIVTVSMALGDYYCRNGQLNKGFGYLAQAKITAANTQDFYYVAVANKIEAVHYGLQKNFPKALSSIDSCIQYFEDSKDPRLLQGMFYEKAVILRSSGNLNEAIVWAKKDLDLAFRTHSQVYAYTCYLLLSEIEKEQQHFEQALLYHQQYASYKDSVYNHELESKLAEERTKQNIEGEQDARRKAELEAEALTFRNRLYGAVAVSLLLILLTVAYLFRQLQKTRKQLLFQNDQLVQLNQTKDKFFGIIAHDLRNPLTAFQGVGDQLNFYLEKGDTAKLQKISGLIAKSAASLSGLLDNLLAWALLNRGMIPYNPEPLLLSAEVAANFDVHESAAAAKGIRLESKVIQDTFVLADRNALQTILRNLVGNALKFSEPGGTVRLYSEVKADTVFISVQDSGAGITPDKLDKLFTLEKRSEQGTAGEKGAGLGLLLCKELVEMNKGTLRVSSIPGKGSTFEFTLPFFVDSLIR